MLSQPESLISLFLYFIFFGLIGAHRGWKKELFVLVLAFFTYLGLLQTQGRLAFIINTGGNYVLSGFPSDQEGLLQVFQAPPLIGPENRETFIFVAWVLILALLYILGDKIFQKDPGGSRSLGFVAGIGNGILYLSLIATRLFPIFNGGSDLAEAPPGTQVQRVVGQLQSFLRDQSRSFFAGFSQSEQRTLIVFLIFAIIGIAAYTLYFGRRSSPQGK